MMTFQFMLKILFRRTKSKNISIKHLSLTFFTTIWRELEVFIDEPIKSEFLLVNRKNEVEIRKLPKNKKIGEKKGPKKIKTQTN